MSGLPYTPIVVLLLTLSDTHDTIIEWLEHIWQNTNWYSKIYGNPLEKVITILWDIWTQRNNIVFRNQICNPVNVLEMAKKVFHDTIYLMRALT